MDQNQTINSMEAASNIVELIDTHHLGKVTYLQIILGSRVKIIDSIIIDPSLLSLVKVSKETCMVVDCIYDAKVLQLPSYDAFDQIELHENEYNDRTGALSSALALLRLLINAVDSDTILKKRRLGGACCSFIWFASMEVILPITLTNFANCTFGLIWLAMQKIHAITSSRD